MKTKYDFILGICSMGSISDFTMMSIEQLHLESPYWFKSSFHNYDTIGRARSRIATRFLATNDSNILIFLDTDVGFKPDDITKLVKAVEKGYDIVAGGYIMRDGNTFAIRTWEPLKLDGKIHEVEYVSTGFLAISRKALEQIRDKLELPLLHANTPDAHCYPFFEAGRDLTGKHDFFMSEDWDFCNKATEAGFKIYWHTGVLVGHLKSVVLKYDNEKTQEGV